MTDIFTVFAGMVIASVVIVTVVCLSGSIAMHNRTYAMLGFFAGSAMTGIVLVCVSIDRACRSTN